MFREHNLKRRFFFGKNKIDFQTFPSAPYNTNNRNRKFLVFFSLCLLSFSVCPRAVTRFASNRSFSFFSIQINNNNLIELRNGDKHVARPSLSWSIDWIAFRWELRGKNDHVVFTIRNIGALRIINLTR